MSSPGSLASRLEDEIRRSGPMPFVRYMDRALYEPGLGYYDRAEARIGRAGDFVTSPSMSPAFGRTLARLVGPLRQATEAGDHFRVVDAGAGKGDLLAALAPAAAPIEPVLVERGDGLRARAARRLAGLGQPATTLARPSELRRLEPRPGLVIANELFDALPARRMRRGPGGLEEAHVALAGEALAEVWLGAAPEPDLDDLPPGREVAVTPGVPALLADLAAGISRGLIVIIDYGHPRSVLRDPEGGGSPIRGFDRGTIAASAIARPGEIDLTAHVDFSAIHHAALGLGLEPLFFTDQTYLLLALGFLDDPAATRARRLIHPEDMGGAFRCLGLGKGIDPRTFAALPLRDRLRHLSPP